MLRRPVAPGASRHGADQAPAEAPGKAAKGGPDPPQAAPRGQNGLQEPAAKEDFVNRIVKAKA